MTKRQKILYRLAADAEMTAEQLSEALGISVLSIRVRLAELHNDGAIAIVAQRKRPRGRPVNVWGTKRLYEGRL